MQKKIITFLIAVSLLFGACQRNPQIDEISFVKIIGIDYDEALVITVGIELPKKESDEKTNVGESISVKCNSVAEGLNKIESLSKKHIFYGQITSIVLGESYASLGIDDCIDYFVRSNNFRFDLPVIITRSVSAKAVIEDADSDDEHISATVDGLFDSAKYNSLSSKITLAELTEMLESAYLTPYLPYIEKSNDSLSLNGYCVFANDAVADFADDDNSKAISILNNRAESFVWIAGNTAGTPTIKVSKLKTVKKLENGVFQIKITAEAELLQYYADADTDEIAPALNDYICNLIDASLARYSSSEIDIGEFCEIYKDAGGRKPEEFLCKLKTTEYNITVDSKLAKEKTVSKPVTVK